MNGKTLLTVATLLLMAPGAGSSFAQALEHERANVLSIDFNTLKVELRDAKGRTFTRSFARDATVKFTDGASFFANPSVHDLRAPMYVHYMFQNDVIEQFDVVELGFDPSASATQKGQGQPRTVVGRVLAYDAKQRQLELELEGTSGTSEGTRGGTRAGASGGARGGTSAGARGGTREGASGTRGETRGGTRETFQLTDRSKTRVNVGDRVELRTEWSGARELVVELRVLGNEDRSGDRSERPRTRPRP